MLLLVGGVLVVIALYEFAFERNTQRNPTGLAVLVAGLAGIGAGVILMHSLDGSDWLTMVVLAASSLVASFGLCLWRYARLAGTPGVRLTPEVTRSVAIGIGALVLAVIAALIFDSTDDTNIVSLITEQGLRAILFMTLMAVGLVYLAIGVQKARDVSPASKALLLGLLGVAVFAMALFIQSESTGPKFRAELFASMSVLALVVLCWAAMSWLFEIRGKEDAGADQLARRVTLIGGLLALAGIIVRLLFAVQEEIDAVDPSRLATFSIRIVWFLAFAAVMTYVLRSTPFGSWIYAVGGNKEAARQIGVPAARTKTQLFMLVAGAAWLVGILLAFRLNTIQAGTGNGEEFEYIIAAVVGGTLLTGGYGSAIGAAIGALIMAMSQQGISYAGWNTDWRFVFQGGILLVAVYANGYVRRVAEATR
ncbi:MAG: hypothetical protein GY698_05650 [Actinomycetia bacterium]|nr:hypothetical protein [Actinomycetes bacterium]